MKKILISLIIGSLVLGLAGPMIILAQDAPAPDPVIPTTPTHPTMPEHCKLRHDLTNIDSQCGKDQLVKISDYPICCMIDPIMTVTDWIFYILLIVVVLFVIIGGGIILTAAGNPDRVSSGRKFIVFALIGLVIALLAKAIPAVVRFFVGV